MLLVHATGMTTHGAAAALGGFGALGGCSAVFTGLGSSATRLAGNGATTSGGHWAVYIYQKIFFRFIRKKLVF